ncbi:hypothetical protein [Tardiphaga robiniae]|uniref:DUF2946 domain-containing protein n=1 Tax=Tardiphaga robiniae TaxID=943830 RepID=A0A163XQ33_9BRAD|nr:hypothetical protein [Tardiphaga robiniae]KZD21195.1 hypothetical protein A4A58_15580 [Tardiphaga robiniae]
MNLRRTIGQVLAVFVIVGLSFAPLAAPAAAKRLAAAELTDMSAMSADMPCCPDGNKTDDCKDCPLIAMCMLTVAQVVPSPSDGIQAPFQIRRLFFGFDDLTADGLVGVPPDHPPRISI